MSSRGPNSLRQRVADIQSALIGTPMTQLPYPPSDQPLQQNSITKLQALVPVRVATSKVLEGTWVGPALDEARVVGSLFGGAHYILQLGYNQVVGYAASFRLVFVAHMPVEKGVSLTDPATIEDARQTAEAFMHMLNLRRVAGANATQTRQNAAGATLVSSFQGSGSAIPGKPLTGKRADVLIVDDLRDLNGEPYVEPISHTVPGKPVV